VGSPNESDTALPTEAGIAADPIAAIPEDYLTFGKGRDDDHCMGGGARLSATATTSITPMSSR